MVSNQASNIKNGTPLPPIVAWKRLVSDTALVALIGFAILCYRFPILTGSLYVREPVYNFHVATEGDEINAGFVVRNLHPWTVTLTNVKGSCGCTQPIADRPLPARIAPFESVRIRTTFNTSGRAGDAHQPVHLITDDNPQGTQLLIKGHILPERKLNP